MGVLRDISRVGGYRILSSAKCNARRTLSRDGQSSLQDAPDFAGAASGLPLLLPDRLQQVARMSAATCGDQSTRRPRISRSLIRATASAYSAAVGLAPAP